MTRDEKEGLLCVLLVVWIILTALFAGPGAY